MGDRVAGLQVVKNAGACHWTSPSESVRRWDTGRTPSIRARSAQAEYVLHVEQAACVAFEETRRT